MQPWRSDGSNIGEFTFSVAIMSSPVFIDTRRVAQVAVVVEAAGGQASKGAQSGRFDNFQGAAFEHPCCRQKATMD